MDATNRQTSDAHHRSMHPPYGGRGIIINHTHSSSRPNSRTLHMWWLTAGETACVPWFADRFPLLVEVDDLLAAWTSRRRVVHFEIDLVTLVRHSCKHSLHHCNMTVTHRTRTDEHTRRIIVADEEITQRRDEALKVRQSAGQSSTVCENLEPSSSFLSSTQHVCTVSWSLRQTICSTCTKSYAVQFHSV